MESIYDATPISFNQFKNYLPDELVKNFDIDEISDILGIDKDHIIKLFIEMKYVNSWGKITRHPSKQKFSLIFDIPLKYDYYKIYLKVFYKNAN